MNVPNTPIYKASLGIPFYGKYKSVEDVNFNDLKSRMVDHKSAFVTDITIELENLQDKSGSDIDELKEAFVLSTNAKKFMIASHLIEWTSKSVFHCKQFKFVFWGGLYYFLTANFNEKLLMFEKPFMLRLGMYMILFSLTSMIALNTLHKSRTALDLTCDSQACKLGPEYAAGGVEYYEKAIKRIDLLRKLMPEPEVLNNFDENSDILEIIPPYGFRAKINDRLSVCKEAKENLDKGLPVESGHFFTRHMLETIVIP